MSSRWWTETRAVARKEFMHEFRSLSGLATSALFGLVAVVTISIASQQSELNKTVAAGLLWVVIVFSGVLALPRIFLVEEEQGTADLLRLMGRADAVYWGKGIFAFALQLAISAVVTALFVMFNGIPVVKFDCLLISLVGGSMSIAGSVALCAAIAMRATNAVILAATISVPLLTALVTLGTTGTRTAFGVDAFNRGLFFSSSLVAYGIATFLVGSLIFPAVWRK